MSQIEEEGFLSTESEDGKVHLIGKYQELFDYARELNHLCMEILVNLKIDWEDEHKLIVQTLFLRLVEGFQGIFLMLERGMMPESKVLTRSMLEVTFTLVALQKKPDLISAYLDQHHDSHRRSLKSALKFKNPNLREAVKKHGIEKLFIEKKKELKDKELNVLSPKEWADAAELEDFYNVYYVIYSNSIHSNLSALDDHVDKKEDEINLSLGPSDIDLYEVLKCGVFLLINGANSTELVNGNDISNKLDVFVEKIQEFDHRYIESAS